MTRAFPTDVSHAILRNYRERIENDAYSSNFATFCPFKYPAENDAGRQFHPHVIRSHYRYHTHTHRLLISIDL